MLTNFFFLKHHCSRISPTHRCLQCPLAKHPVHSAWFLASHNLASLSLFVLLHLFIIPTQVIHSSNIPSVCDVHITIKDLSAIYLKLISLSTFCYYFLCPWLISFIRIHTGIHTITYLPMARAEWKMKGICVWGKTDVYLFVISGYLLLAGVQKVNEILNHISRIVPLSSTWVKHH